MTRLVGTPNYKNICKKRTPRVDLLFPIMTQTLPPGSSTTSP